LRDAISKGTIETVQPNRKCADAAFVQRKSVDLEIKIGLLVKETLVY